MYVLKVAPSTAVEGALEQHCHTTVQWLVKNVYRTSMRGVLTDPLLQQIGPNHHQAT